MKQCCLTMLTILYDKYIKLTKYFDNSKIIQYNYLEGIIYYIISLV